MPNPYLAAVLKEQQERRQKLAAQSEGGYDALKVPDLKAEIDRRNEGRPEADLIAPSGALKADLIKALEADDRNDTEES